MSQHGAPHANSTPIPAIASSARETPAPLRRHDTLRQKQKLHDVLGDAGLVYWRSFNAYLMGKLSQREFVELVRSLLKTPEKSKPPDPDPLTSSRPAQPARQEHPVQCVAARRATSGRIADAA
jgi:hypothetical protein